MASNPADLACRQRSAYGIFDGKMPEQMPLMNRVPPLCAASAADVIAPANVRRVSSGFNAELLPGQNLLAIHRLAPQNRGQRRGRTDHNVYFGLLTVRMHSRNCPM